MRGHRGMRLQRGSTLRFELAFYSDDEKGACGGAGSDYDPDGVQLSDCEVFSEIYQNSQLIDKFLTEPSDVNPGAVFFEVSDTSHFPLGTLQYDVAVMFPDGSVYYSEVQYITVEPSLTQFDREEADSVFSTS